MFTFMNFVTYIADSACFHASLNVFTWGFCDSLKISHLTEMEAVFDKHYFEIVDALGSVNLFIILLQSMSLGKREIPFIFVCVCPDFSISTLEFIQ